MASTTTNPNPPVALILGAGPRIGLSIAAKLTSEGYKVALGRRSPENNNTHQSDPNITPVAVDVSDPSSITAAFTRVKHDLGIPKVVVYNAAALSFPSDLSDPVGSITTEMMESDFRVNALGGYAALREAVEGFKTLKKKEGDNSNSNMSPNNGVFIATGNVTPFQPLPMALTLGVGKSALVHMLQVAVEAYRSDGFRFYFPSQVTEAGAPVPHPEVNGETHGRVYRDLIQKSSQGNWDVRFLANGTEVRGK